MGVRSLSFCCCSSASPLTWPVASFSETGSVPLPPDVPSSKERPSSSPSWEWPWDIGWNGYLMGWLSQRVPLLCPLCLSALLYMGSGVQWVGGCAAGRAPHFSSGSLRSSLLAYMLGMWNSVVNAPCFPSSRHVTTSPVAPSW